MPSVARRSSQGSCVVPNHYISSGSLHPEQFPGSFLTLGPKDFCRLSGNYFVECLSIDICLMFSHYSIQFLHLAEVIPSPHRVLSWSTSCKSIPSLMMNRITWIRRSLQDSCCRVPLFLSYFSCITNMHFVRDTLTLFTFFFLFQLSPTHFRTYCFLPELLINMMVTKWWFSNSIIASMLLVGFTIRKKFPISLIYLFTYLWQRGLMNFYFKQ